MPEPSAQYLSLPFSQAVDFFRDKVSLPSERWDDLWQGMHSRAFVVAGATKTELLADLRGAVDKAISQGTTLAEFRKDFDSIVEKHGWQYKGNRAWRTAVIYDTNLTVAYSAGRYKGMTADAVLAARPWWKYLPSSSAQRRPEHVQWYGIVLRHDDPWWNTHYPPNGWGCKCGVTSMSNREYERTNDRLRTTAPEDSTYDHINRQTGEITKVPVGIDPGWDYNPGVAAWGKKLADTAMAQWQAQKADAWQTLTPGDWMTYSLPERLTPVAPAATLGPKLTTVAATRQSIAKIIGSEEQVYSLVADEFRYDLLVNAEALASHLAQNLDRTPYLPFIPEALSDPDEVWMRFDQHKGTGKVVLRQRVIKAIDLGKKTGMLVVFDASNGMLESWTMLPITKSTYINQQRTGKLVYQKKDGQAAAATPAPQGD